MEEDNQDGAPWTLVLRRWNDGDHTMPHKMKIKCVKDHIYHIIYAYDVYPFMHLILLRFDRAVAL
jgi:hypothetical protein